jgi:hypothetical protein
MNLPDLILRNFWLKFFSVALALVIWLGIHFGIRNEFSVSHLDINNILAHDYIRVPVTVVPRPGDTRVFKVSPPDVVVIAVGEEAVLHGARENIRAYVDLTQFRTGPSVEEVHADVPPTINVLEISPAAVTVEQASQ